MTKEDIRRIHSKGIAVKNKKYFDNEGNVYIGIDKGRLRLLDKASNTTFKSNTTLKSNNVQNAIEEIINSTDFENFFLVKEVEIDFGTELYQTEKKFIITDSDIDSNDIVSANVSYKKPSSKDLDELEMDIITIKAAPYNGGAYLYLMSSTGSLHGKFIVSYQIKKN